MAVNMRIDRSGAIKTVRLCLGLFGGYAFTAAYIGLAAVLLSQLGMARGEATSFAILSGVFVYVGVLVWAAATSRPLRTAALVISTSIASVLLAAVLA